MNACVARAVALCALVPLAATLAGCIGAAVVGGGAALLSAQDRRTSGTQIEDEGIELRAGNRISERFGDKVHVNITSFNRSALLTGEVPDDRSRAEVEKLVLSVPNVRGVSNELLVAGVSTLGSRGNDSFITSKVKARFVDSRKFNPVHVKVVTEGAVVFLLGQVTDQEATDAVELARTTGGVRKVVKIFDYCRPTDATCRLEAAKGDAKK
jgi:osmotically-inducible protein OsmY